MDAVTAGPGAPPSSAAALPPPDALQALLLALAQAGARLSVNADRQLVLSAPRGLSEALLQRVRACKAELVAQLEAQAAQPSAAALAVVPDPAARHEPFPLADLQTAFAMGDGEAMEFHVRPHYYTEQSWPGLDPARYERALNTALHRQRANLLTLGHDLRLRCLPSFVPVRVAVHDLRGLSAEQAAQALQATRERLSRRTLPLDRWPWFDCEISLHGHGQARLHWNLNNFFGDGLGTTVLLADVRRLYEDPGLVLPELTLSYRDCVLALQRIERSPLGERSRDYWLQRLPHLPGLPPVPLRAGLDPRRRSRLQRREALLLPLQWAGFKALARRHGLTPTNALYAAHAEVLARWSGSRHFLLNSMATHRQLAHPEIREVLGNFASLYPLEVDWRGGGTFAQRAMQLQSRSLSDLQHTHWSGVKVLQALNQARDTPGRAPCPFVVGSGLFMPPLERPVHSCLETPQTLLDHQFWELRDGAFWTVWDVIEEAFPAGLVDAMWQAYRGLLERLCSDEAAWVQTGFELLPPGQRERRMHVNDTRRVLPEAGGLLHQGLARSARRWPHRLAVIDPGRRLSYAQLHGRANHLAHVLRAAGVQPGERVAVMLDKGWQQVVAVYGVLAAGAVYVPIDPGWPAARTQRLLDGVQAAHVVTRTGLREALPLPAGLCIWCVDDPALGGHAPPDLPEPPSLRQPSDPAYIIFTSGSTGEPKGVTISHHGALNTVAAVNQRFRLSRRDVVFGISALHFDLSVYDLFGPLAVGATLVLPPACDVHVPDPQAWAQQLYRHGVTVWNSVPALMQLLVDALEVAGLKLPQLRTVLLSGDSIPVSLPGRIQHQAPQAQVVSLGGATEASIWSIHHPIAEADPAWPGVPYGRPMANQRWHVLHEDGFDAPDWVPGVLHIAGEGLALGYWGDEARTREAFVPHPRTGERLYRTGDLGRYLPDGEIEFLGRDDFQVKVQGLRVELGEIEQALRAHPLVEAAVVLAPPGLAGRQLMACVVAARGGPPLAMERDKTEVLRQHLGERLPGYMVPDVVLWLERLPLTPTGKVDRAALQRQLPASAGAGAGQGGARPGFVAPRTPLEATLAAIWQEVLGLPRVGIEDDFFALGGQSFAAVQVMTRVAQQLGERLPLGALLEGRSVARLAEWLQRQRTRRAAWSPLVTLSTAGEGPPVFLVHPAGGQVLCYRALAEQLDRPVHALQAQGLSCGEPLDSVGAMAALYLPAVRQVQPRGPYLLGGWSSGGLIAFEMARRLEADGEVVAQVLLWDSPAPCPQAAPDPRRLALWFVQDLGLGFDPTPACLGRVPGDVPPEAQLDAALALAAAQPGASAPDLDRAALQRLYAVFRGVVHATRAYSAPHGALRADLTVLRAREGQVAEFLDHPHRDAPDWGWQPFTRGVVRSRAVPGNHHTMLAPQNLVSLLYALRPLVRAAGGAVAP